MSEAHFYAYHLELELGNEPKLAHQNNIHSPLKNKIKEQFS